MSINYLLLGAVLAYILVVVIVGAISSKDTLLKTPRIC